MGSQPTDPAMSAVSPISSRNSQPNQPLPPYPEAMPLPDSSWIRRQLLEIGLGEGEVEATLETIPTSIRFALPPEVINRMVDGLRPLGGFGLGGAVGCGKTYTLAALLVASLQRKIKTSRDFPPPIHGIRWACWPVDSANCGNLDVMRNRVEELANVPMLILDDLGRERLKGNYGEDWSRSNLDRIITQRNRRRLPILWTTNCSFAELGVIYGPGMLSRLCEINPLIWLDGLANLRKV